LVRALDDGSGSDARGPADPLGEEPRPAGRRRARVVSAPPPGEADEEARYATLLEEVFIAERGTPFLLSAKDWTLIRGWRERGVPVDTAIRAIQETFEKRRARGAAGKISSVAYCANAVDERWELERRGLV